MPKLIYSIPRIKAERERDRLIAAGRKPFDGSKLRALFGANRKASKPAPFLVFEFLEKALAGKSLGSRATYTEEKARSGWIGYVYENALNSYFLVERRCFPSGGGNPRIEKVALPKKFRQK